MRDEKRRLPAVTIVASEKSISEVTEMVVYDFVLAQQAWLNPPTVPIRAAPVGFKPSHVIRKRKAAITVYDQIQKSKRAR